MKKILVSSLLVSVLLLNSSAMTAMSKTSHKKMHKAHVSKNHDTHGSNGNVTPKSIGAGALSLLIWPGIGQLMNDEKNTDKVMVHALLGLTGIFRIWSCYDGVVDRTGGVWEDRI